MNRGQLNAGGRESIHPLLRWHATAPHGMTRGMRVVTQSALVALALALTGCPPSKAPPDSAGTQKVRDPDWWRGTWQIDVERLVAEAKRDALSPDAQRIVAALAQQAVPQYRYELAPDGMRRKTPRSDDIVPVTVRVLNADVVQIEAGSAGRLRIRRTAAGVVLTDNDKTFPVRQARVAAPPSR